MIREERAKQFAPFDAMKGLQEALRDREERHTRVERHDVSEEQMEENSRILSMLAKGTQVRLECYRDFHDVTLTGAVTAIDTVFQYLRVGSEKILFRDIYTIQIM